MARLAAALAPIVWLIYMAVIPAAAADPGQPPGPGEAAACEQAWLPPLDPRVNMRYGLGTLAYTAWVHAQCAGPDAKFPNGAAVAGSGLAPDVPAWQKLPPADSAPDTTGVLG